MPFSKNDPNINRNGRPRKPEVEKLRDALEKLEQEKGAHFIEHFVRSAYDNHTIAVALAKKLLPDMFEGKGFEPKESGIIIIRNKDESEDGRIPKKLHL